MTTQPTTNSRWATPAAVFFFLSTLGLGIALALSPPDQSASVAQLEGELADRDAEIADQQGLIDAAREVNAEHAEQLDEAQQASAQLDALRQEHEQAMQHISSLLEAKEQAELQFRELSLANDRLQASMSEQRSQYEQQIAALNEQAQTELARRTSLFNHQLSEAESNHVLQMQEAALARERLELEIAEQAQAIVESASQLQTLQAQLAEANATLMQTAAANEVIARSMEANRQTIAELQQALNDSIAQIGELNQMVQTQQQALINQRSDNARLTDNYRRMQQRNVALEQRISELEELIRREREDNGGDEFPPSDQFPIDDPEPPVNVRIDAAVVALEELRDGVVLIQISAGSQDQVREGLEFVISRGDEFIGNLQISTVDREEAVGRLTLGEGVQVGDTVTYRPPQAPAD